MRQVNKVLGAMAAAVGLAILYFAVYLTMVIPRPDGFDPESLELEVSLYSFRSVATYRFGGIHSRWFFTPANELDRWMRPKTWEFDPFSGLPGSP